MKDKLINKEDPKGIFRAIKQSLLLGAIPPFFLILIQPANFMRYSFAEAQTPQNRMSWFVDIENDGHKEKFQLGFNPDSTACIYFQ